MVASGRRCASCYHLLEEYDIFCGACGIRCVEIKNQETVKPLDEEEIKATKISEHWIAHRSDLHMLGNVKYTKKNIDLHIYPPYDIGIGYYKGHIYKVNKDDKDNSVILYRINQKTSKISHTIKLDHDYGNIYGVNRCGIFFVKNVDGYLKSYAEKIKLSDGWEHSGEQTYTITNIGFDGTFLGQVQIKSEYYFHNEMNWEIYQGQPEWIFILNDTIYYTYGYGVKSVNITSGKENIIYEFNDLNLLNDMNGGKIAAQSEAVKIKFVLADTDYIYFNITINKEYIKYDMNIFNNLKNNDNYWYRYNNITSEIECISSTCIDLFDIFTKPEMFLKNIYDPIKNEWADNPKFKNDLSYINIRVIDIVNGIMWISHKNNNNILEARSICITPGHSTNQILEWQFDTWGENVYFDGNYMIIANNLGRLLSVYDKLGNVLIKQHSTYYANYMFIAGDYIYGGFNVGGNSEEMNRIKISNGIKLKVESAPEIYRTV